MNDNLKKGKVQLVLSEPFFASLFLGMRMVSNENIQTACTDGISIEYNPKYVEALTVPKVKGLLAHEVLHPALLHHTRRNGRDMKKWNMACDYAINPILIQAGFELPDGALIDPKYFGMTADDIYPFMTDEDDDGQGGNDPNGLGGVKDAPAKSKSDINEIEAQMKQKVSQAAMAAKKAGKLPAYLDRFVTEALEPKITWQDALARYLTEIARNDYTWKKPNRRYISMGIYLPSLENEELGQVILIGDTSGSMNKRAFNITASEMQAILATFKVGFDIIYVDYVFQGMQHIEPDEEMKLHPKGGGGTSFRPGFEYIDEQGMQPKAVVYFTDGDCDEYPDTAPAYPVLWAQIGNHPFKPPFGEVIKIRI